MNLHTLLLSAILAWGFGLVTHAQYFVNINGHHIPCTPELQDNVVTIQSLPGTEPSYNVEVPINSNCYYTATFEITSNEYSFLVISACDDQQFSTLGDTAVSVPPGTTIIQDLWFGCGQAPPTCQSNFTFAQEMSDGEPVPFSMVTTNLSTGNPPFVFNWLLPDFTWSNDFEPGFVFSGPGTYDICLQLVDANNCTSTLCTTVVVQEDGTFGEVEAPDCEGTPGGSALPGTACFDEDTNMPGTWNADCVCVPDPEPDCEAGFWAIQAYEVIDPNDTTTVVPIPYTLWIWNLSSGGSGTYTFTWDFGDGNTSTEPFPTHVYAGSGPYELCLTMLDDEGCTDTYCEELSVDDDGFLGLTTDGLQRSALTINVIQQLPTGINEQPTLAADNLWPNPAQDQVQLLLNSSRGGTLDLSIVDMHGRQVMRSQVGIHAGRNQLPLDVAGLGKGMYIIRLMNGDRTAAIRFVKH